MIYYLVDDFGSTFDPAAMNMSDPAQVEKLLKSMLIDQTIATKKLVNDPVFQNVVLKKSGTVISIACCILDAIL